MMAEQAHFETVEDALNALAGNDEYFIKVISEIKDCLKKLQEGHAALYEAWQTQNHEIESLKMQLTQKLEGTAVEYTGKSVPQAY